MQCGRDPCVSHTSIVNILKRCSTPSRPWVAGISGGPKGAYSVALSGGYPDDVDWGYALYFFFLFRHACRSNMLSVPIPDQVGTYPNHSDAISTCSPGGRNLKGTKANPLNVRESQYQMRFMLIVHSFSSGLRHKARTRPLIIVLVFRCDFRGALTNSGAVQPVSEGEDAWT